MSSFELAGRSLRVAWAQDQSKPALSVLPPGLSPAAAAAQAASMAAKVASSAAGGAAAAAAAHRINPSGVVQQQQRHSGFGNGNGVMMHAGGGRGGAAAAMAAAAAQHQGAGLGGGFVGASRCMCLMNMLGPEEADDEEVKAEILEEFGTCGTVQQFHVHKQRAPNGAVVAVRVFVVYNTPGEAALSIRKMHGRFFAGRQVQAVPYDQGMLSKGMLDA
ncbi:unnamed protein product [Laminaria digitata]